MTKEEEIEYLEEQIIYTKKNGWTIGEEFTNLLIETYEEKIANLKGELEVDLEVDYYYKHKNGVFTFPHKLEKNGEVWLEKSGGVMKYEITKITAKVGK